MTIDKVTGEELGSSYWTSNKGQFETVITPEVEGYSADKDKVEGKTVGQRNLEETVVYIPLTGDINGKPKEDKADDIVVEEIQDLEVLDQVEEQVESHDGPVTYGPGDDFEAPVSVKLRVKALNTRCQLISQMRKKQAKVRLKKPSISQASPYR